MNKLTGPNPYLKICSAQIPISREGNNCLQSYHFRQDSTFLYFFGIDQASLTGVLDADSGEAMLFGDDYDIEMIVWTGVVPTISSLGEKAGLGDVRPTSVLAGVISAAVAAKRENHLKLSLST